MKSIEKMELWKREMEIIEKALALGADITVTFDGLQKMRIEIKKGEPTPLWVKEGKTTPWTIATGTGKPIWETRTVELTSCETPKD